ncbi:MAG TPA: hypothetical protein PL182_03865 [Pseudobdellovibrionaceae bacterium]|nr:hypothetical protein [Pseudobdellovibrionaceae bacterium]
MKAVTGKILMCAALMGALSACGPKEEKSEKKIVQVTTTSKMSGDELTEAGEQLVAPYTFHLADRAFEMALEKNPNDKKAQFYRAFLKRFMVNRGILNRVKPYARNHGNEAGLQQTIKSLPNHPLKTFLLDDKGLSPIADLAGIQTYLTEYRNALQEFRNFVAKNPNVEFDIYLNPHLFEKTIAENLAGSCLTTDNKEGGFDVTCETEGIATLKMNVADLLVLKQEAAGEQLYLTLLTSYSMKGLDSFFAEREASKRHVCEKIERSGAAGDYSNYYYGSADSMVVSTDSQGNWTQSGKRCDDVYPEMSTKDLYAKLASVPEALKLRKDNGLAEVKKIGADFLAAMKWVIKYQKQVCRTGEAGNKANRPGFMFSEGICAETQSDTDQQLALFDQMLNGVIRTDQELENGQIVKMDMDLMAPFVKPVQDLRNIMPATWTSCGTAASLKDPTLGGLFPRGDAGILLTSECK